jgi:hypothetical protein
MQATRRDPAILVEDNPLPERDSGPLRVWLKYAGILECLPQWRLSRNSTAPTRHILCNSLVYRDIVSITTQKDRMQQTTQRTTSNQDRRHEFAPSF